MAGESEALGVFAASIAVMSWASARLTTALERIGARLQFSIGFAPPSPQIVFAALWLPGMKLAALAAASHRHRHRRTGGAMLMLLYLIFAAVIAQW